MGADQNGIAYRYYGFLLSLANRQPSISTSVSINTFNEPSPLLASTLGSAFRCWFTLSALEVHSPNALDRRTGEWE
jgi:hypothetical protein